MSTLKYVIGLNSGTSFDGIDVALVKFNNNLRPVFVNGILYKFPKNIKNKIQETMLEQNKLGTLHDLPLLNFLLGELFAKAALAIIKKNKLKTKNIFLIASHGQTIFHHPWFHNISGHKIRATLQIGESSVIAKRTSIKTVSNFRESDIVAGGEGAPLMPYLDYIYFNESKNIKLVLNIGGISNVTVVGKQITPIAFDIGPGNALIDLVCKKHFKKDFDKDGKLASKGKINFSCVEAALKDPYFKQTPPKSTGKEYFNEGFIKDYFSNIKDKKNKLATITYFSAKVIEHAISKFILPKYKPNELIISGGGIKNKTLIKHLKNLLPNVRFVNSDKYKLPSKYKEAILFALLGYTCVKGIKNNIPSCTGAKEKVILGKITRV
ncbi:MAG: anhydro-N-acetylmuramic acid kinase [Candidatus Melainabacteria bacterium]|nr:anhydro-N-acetylmuramic acid kinase [Candidatus Melainabacteria bacterium]